MTQRFILDENIVIYGQRETNEADERDLTCASLITRIIDICHTLVLDPPLREKYLQQLNRPSHQNPESGSLLLRVLANAFQRGDKVDFRTAARAFPEEDRIPQGSQDDIPIVRLAVATGATLVTTDQSLREDLYSCGVQDQYNLRILSPAQVLEAL